jgi:hypothetical protein
MLEATLALVAVSLVLHAITLGLAWRIFTRPLAIRRVIDRKETLLRTSSAFEGDVLSILQRIDERVKEPPKPALSGVDAEAAINRIVAESVALGETSERVNAENGVKFKGADKLRVALTHAQQRLQELNLTVEQLPLRIEAEVGLLKQKGLPG